VLERQTVRCTIRHAPELCRVYTDWWTRVQGARELGARLSGFLVAGFATSRVSRPVCCGEQTGPKVGCSLNDWFFTVPKCLTP
jgi:hypothetical protein